MFYILSEEPVAASTDRRDVPVLSSPLMHIEGFLLALTNADKDGRIVLNKQRKSTHTKDSP